MVERAAPTCTSPPTRRRRSASTASCAPLDLPPLTAGRDQAAGLQRAHRRAEAPLRGEPRARLLFGIKGLARFRANVFIQRGAVGGRLPHHPLRDPRLRGARPAAGGRRAVREAARPGAGDRPDRLGQVHHARGDDRQDQHASATSTSSPSRTRSSTCTRTRSCLVNQREVARRHARPSRNALRVVLREDPDVVLIGEMRDLETIEAALRIAETGHLTFAHAAHQLGASRPSTASSTSSRRTSSRRSAPSCRSCSRAIMCQALLPEAGGHGRACWPWRS